MDGKQTFGALLTPTGLHGVPACQKLVDRGSSNGKESLQVFVERGTRLFGSRVI